MTKDEWFDNLEVINQLTLAETAIARINVPNTNGKYIIIDKMPGMNPTEDDPILWIKGSIVTENDIYVRGSITSTTDFASGEESGGGALLLSHGWVGSGTQSNPIAVSPPLIQLMTSETQIKSGPSLPTENMTDQAGQIFNHTGQNRLYIWSGSNWIISETIFSGKYDTLFLVKNDNYSPANLDLGDLTAHGKLMLKSTDSTFAVAAGDNYPTDNNAYLIPINPPDGGLGLGTATYPFKWVDATTVFTNEVNSLNYGGITLFDKLKFGGQNNDVYLDRAGNGVLQVYNSTGQAGTFNASNIFVDHINSLSGGAVTLYKPLGYPFTAGAAISAYRIVAMNANNTVVTANRSNATKQVGVAVADINSGQQGVIAYSGAVQVRAGMNLTAGMHVTTDDQGRAYQYSGHNHTITSLTIQNANIGAHNHQAGANLQTSTQGNHSHGFPAGYAATDTQGAHQHGFPSGSAATDTVGNHSHGFPSGYAATDSQGSHSHGASSGSTNIAHTHGITMGSANTGTTSGHYHSYAYSVSPTQSAGGSHNHSISTDSAGNHSHAVGGSTGYTGDHSHSVGGSTGSAGGHSHSVGGSTGSAGDHSHSVGGYTGDVWTGSGGIGQGSHTHSLDSGSTNSLTDERPIGVVIIGASTDQLATILLGA